MTSLASFLAPSITAGWSARPGTAKPIPTAQAANAATTPRLPGGLDRPARVARALSAIVLGILCRTADEARDRTKAERGRHEQRVNSRAPGHDDIHVRRPIGHADMIGIADLGKPARATVPQPFDRAARQAAERKARMRKYGLTDFRLADPVARQRCRVLGAYDDERPARGNDV